MIYNSYYTKDNKTVDNLTIVDWEIVNEICNFEKDVYDNILKIFFKEFDLYIKNISKKNEISEIQLIAHAIKGSAATIGFNSLSCCSNWYMSNSNIINVKEYKKEFIISLNQSKKDIQKEIKQNKDLKMF